MDVHTIQQAITLRVDQLKPRDLITRDRGLWVGGSPAIVVARANRAGWSDGWHAEIWHVVLVNGVMIVRPAWFRVKVVAEARVA